MMKCDEFCYWCGKQATSREHVPPKGLFPEAKDTFEVYGKSFRNNLITVPSCDEHNLHKSHDDEYLMACISGVVGNNGIGFVHNATKARRARERNSNLVKVVSEGRLIVSNREYPIQWVETESIRLARSFESIARSLYFHEMGSRFHGECKVFSAIFTRSPDKEWSEYNARAVELLEKEKKIWGTISKGENPDIFQYQFSPRDGFDFYTVALTFYKTMNVFVILCILSQKELEELMPKFEPFTKFLFE